MTATVDRIQVRATTIRPGRAALEVLAWPLWLLGWLFGSVWVAVRFIGGAVMVGFDDARGRSTFGDG